MHGRKTPSDYCDGLYTYWVGLIDGNPYSLIMTLQEKAEYDIPEIKKSYISNTGTTYSMDFMIGDKDNFGKGLGAITLKKFIEFFKENYDNQVDTFFIDPDVSNPRARHVYEKAGFKYVADFTQKGTSFLAGRQASFLIKRINKSGD